MDRKKMSIEEFLEFKKTFMEILVKSETAPRDQQDAIMKEYYTHIDNLSKYDLSDIPAEMYDGILLYKETGVIDLSGTGAHIDTRILRIGGSINFKGCNIDYFEPDPYHEMVYSEDSFDEEFIESHKSLFPPKDFPEEFRIAFFEGNVRFNNLIELTDEQLDELSKRGCNFLEYLDTGYGKELIYLIASGIDIFQFVKKYREVIEYAIDNGETNSMFEYPVIRDNPEVAERLLIGQYLGKIKEREDEEKPEFLDRYLKDYTIVDHISSFEELLSLPKDGMVIIEYVEDRKAFMFCEPTYLERLSHESNIFENGFVSFDFNGLLQSFQYKNIKDFYRVKNYEEWERTFVEYITKNIYDYTVFRIYNFDYTHVDGPIRERYPDLFFARDMPEDLTQALSNPEKLAKLLKANPEYINFFLKRNPVDFFGRHDLTVINEEGLLSMNVCLIDYSFKKFGPQYTYEMIAKYGNMFYYPRSYSTIHLRPDKESFERELQDSIYEVLTQSTYHSNYSYLEDCKDLVDRFPQLFLPKDAPQELKDKFYGVNKQIEGSFEYEKQKLTYQDFVDHPEWLKYFEVTDLAIGLGLVALKDNVPKDKKNEYLLKVLKEMDRLSSSEKSIQTFIDYLSKNKVTMEQLPLVSNLIYNITVSNSGEIRTMVNELTFSLLASSDDPKEIMENFVAIEKIFLFTYLPEVGKRFFVFDRLNKNLSEKIDSPSVYSIMLKQNPDAQKRIIIEDLLKIALRSNNRSIKEYLNGLEVGDKLFEGLITGKKSIESITKEEIFTLSKFMYQLEILYASTKPEVEYHETGNLLTDLTTMYKLMTGTDVIDPNNLVSLADIVVDRLCSSLGLHSISDVRGYMTRSIREAEERNIRASQNIEIKEGDLIKGLTGDGIFYLASILQNGSVAKDFLGSAADSDATPLDTDVTMLGSTSKGLKLAVESSYSAGWGPIWFVIKNDDRFVRTGPKKSSDDFGKYELFETSAGKRTCGIRTGIAVTDVDYIMVEERDARVEMLIARNGFYIPIIDKTGNLLYSYDQFLEMRKSMAGLSYYDTPSYSFSEYLSIPDMPLDELGDFSGVEEENTRKSNQENREFTHEMREGIDVLIDEALSEFSEQTGIKIKRTERIPGDIKPGTVELIDTGSTSRGTNKYKDADFDFVMNLDKLIILDPEKKKLLVQILLKKLAPDVEDYSPYLLGEDIRELPVKIGDTEVPLDISFRSKTDILDYSTDECLRDRLETIRRQDPEKYEMVVANIVYAKAVLKAAECYKPDKNKTKQGGLGGVGVENWILQHGGSFYEAAKSFVEASEGKSFEEFRESYAVWDFGENHFAAEKTESGGKKFPFDNFVYNNMNPNGYAKMRRALKTFVDQYEARMELDDSARKGAK